MARARAKGKGIEWGRQQKILVESASSSSTFATNLLILMIFRRANSSCEALTIPTAIPLPSSEPDPSSSKLSFEVAVQKFDPRKIGFLLNRGPHLLLLPYLVPVSRFCVCSLSRLRRGDNSSMYLLRALLRAARPRGALSYCGAGRQLS